ncbi:MAG: PHB depolymerase family esterase [Streptosporangiaceae bacterium]|nr:PHB depolymerase family esterase [Streptosporangiaceae bacterium]
MKRWLGAMLAVGVAALTPVAFFQMAPQAKAASLVQVTNFGNNPSNNKMYIYVPNNVRSNPPILVALHECTGTGPGFFSGTAFASLADQFGFIVIYPDANRSGQCWDVSSSQALTRNGGSDPVGIMSMVTYAEQHFGGNANQVYVTGASSGAMMTDVLLADYPDVFKAGAAFMGVPYHCFFTGTVDGWNSACADGQVSMTAQQWGDLARNADPGYSGPRPRVQLWHGTADGTLNYNNFGQEILQWTNVLGVSATPVATLTPTSGWTETQYGSSSNPVVEGFSIAGADHVLPIEGTGMEADAIHFFGLDNQTQRNTVTVTNPGNQTSTPGTATSVQIHATDSAAGQTLSYSAAGLPAGLSINSSTGLISGTPSGSSTSSVTVTVTDSTGASGSTTFTWTVGTSTSPPPPPPGTCHVTYQTTSQWAGGFTASVTIGNTSSTALSSWTLAFTFPGDQHITSSWNGTATQSGENVTITNASYNGSIPASGSTSIGFQGTWTASDAAPTSFSVNGAACT